MDSLVLKYEFRTTKDISTYGNEINKKSFLIIKLQGYDYQGEYNISEVGINLEELRQELADA